MNLRKIFIIGLFIGIFVACSKNRLQPVPYYSFDTTINLDLPSYSSLKGVSGWAYVPNIGSKGVVVYRKSVTVFMAFDRQSTVDGGIDCSSGLVVNEDNFLLLDDPCSDAQYSLYDGSVVKGDAKWGLRQYQTQFNGSNILRIYNP